MNLLVITPTLGESRWLDETVASVAAAGARHLLVAPAACVPSLQNRFVRVTVVPEPGGGMYAAINAGIAAGGDWDAFTYLNDDDVLLPDFACVAESINTAEGRPLIAYGAVRLIDATGRRIGTIPTSPRSELNRQLYAQGIEPVYQHGTLVSRAAFAVLGGFDATFRYCGDSEFLARACLQGVPFTCATRREVAAFRVHAGQLTQRRSEMITERRRVDDKLQLRQGATIQQRLARLRFRLANLPSYLGRIRRYGFISFDEMLVRIGRDYHA
jgi:glycosyltransferase involved in cell wall biosynthesis